QVREVLEKVPSRIQTREGQVREVLEKLPSRYRRVKGKCVRYSRRCRRGYRRVKGRCVRRGAARTGGSSSSGSRGRRRCPPGFQTVRSGRRRRVRCVRRSSKRCGKYFRRYGRKCIRVRCPRSMKSRRIRSRVRVGKRVAGYTKKCSCIGAKTGKKPSKKNAIDMAFVVDVTGSMGSVIRAIKAKIREVINANAKSRIVNKFVLVPYGDPKVGPVTATRARSRSSVNSLIRAVNAMRASGGGDCAGVRLLRNIRSADQSKEELNCVRVHRCESVSSRQ
uniref:VWFA domain-containing protein n=1 Tax=Macrostomum lignano TaxID=282301 RepID=A0A1I8GGX9_9PLAT